jgi:biotin-(acetyl-CoA carboxylase) ligase
MSLPVRTRLSNKTAPDIQLPPPFRLVTLREVGDAFSHAVANAADAGAGTLVFVGRFDLVEFALVLEPDEPLRQARRTIYAGMHALGDALSVHAPPEKPIVFRWPDAIAIDGGLVGGARLAWPDGADEDAPPSWLVFGATIRTVSMADGVAALNPLSAALEEEGFDDLASGRLLETFARHFMVAVDAWQDDGFASIGKNYLMRLAPEQGVRHGLDDKNGDLLLRRAGRSEVERRELVPALAVPSWLDPVAGGPRV